MPITNPFSKNTEQPTSGSSIHIISNFQSLLDVLLAENLISQAQFDQIKIKSSTTGRSLEEIIASDTTVSEEKIAQAKSKLLGVPFISLTATSFSPQALGYIPQTVAKRFHLIPFIYNDEEKTLSVAMANPVDFDALQFVRQRTGVTIKAFIATLTEIDHAIEKQYGQELVGEIGEAVKETQSFATSLKDQEKTINNAQIGQLIKEAPIAKIVSTILEYAVNSRSSDVHIEPQEDHMRVRYRIDGILYDKLSLPKTVQDAVISRIKILSEMKIDEHRIPQDGRFNFQIGDQEVDLRISVLPTTWGEKIVMRLLRKSGGVPTLPELGLNGIALRNLENTITRPHGIIIVCGPTGSGKTTTLYSVLSKLNTPKVNIVSLEDPVEYQIPGVNQVQVNPAVGLTFATGLRSFLRQDPNIILVGEIRDKETTDLAIQAALTGHLIFSTLHTSNASGALPRLLDLGAENFLLASTMNAIVGQRIVRQICPSCKYQYAPTAQEVTEIKMELGKLFPNDKLEIKLSKGKGCGQCQLSGYIGRIGIFEVLVISEKIARLVLEKTDSATIEKEAILDGMITMKQDGYLKVLQGVTTLEEVIRVAQE